MEVKNGIIIDGVLHELVEIKCNECSLCQECSNLLDDNLSGCRYELRLLSYNLHLAGHSR